MKPTNWAEKLPPLPPGFGPPAGLTCKKLDMFLAVYEMLRDGYTTHEVALANGLKPQRVAEIANRLRRWTFHPDWFRKVYGRYAKSHYRGKAVKRKNKK